VAATLLENCPVSYTREDRLFAADFIRPLAVLPSPGTSLAPANPSACLAAPTDCRLFGRHPLHPELCGRGDPLWIRVFSVVCLNVSPERRASFAPYLFSKKSGVHLLERMDIVGL